ncbi:hypothetical protein Tco_0014609 [Tanacetum coccineum]
MMRDSSNKYFLRLEMWKVLWILLNFLGSSSLYATGSIHSMILNGPIYWGLSFPHESKDTFASLQALTNLHDLFSCFLNLAESSSGIGFGIDVFLGQMSYLVASLTLDSTRTYVM